MEKKKRIISIENLEPAIKDSLMKKYPSGFDPFIQKIQGIKGETLTIVPLETEDSIFLVKVKPEMKKVAEDDDEEDTEGAEIPETTESFGDDDEFSKDEEEDAGFKDEPVEEYDDDDDEEEPAEGGADDDDED